MAKPSLVRSGDTAPASGGGEGSSGRFAELRSLLVGPEQRQLRAIQTRLDDPGTQAQEVSQVLPQAVQLRNNDPQLKRALAPAIEEGIATLVRRDPQQLADALFPAIMPAIRKAIATTLSGMLESVNRTLEHSLSVKSIKWRITARRTGKSFAEIVLLNTLLYRVEQVFLIHRKTGLLLQHVKSGPASVQDADLVSGMLTAIRDFAEDSFRLRGRRVARYAAGWRAVGLDRAGTARDPRGGHSRHSTARPPGRSPGDARELARPFCRRAPSVQWRIGPLRSCQASSRGVPAGAVPQRATQAETVRLGDCRRAAARRRALDVLRVAGARSVERYLQALRSEPGIVVVSADRRGGKYVLTGLRDPLARDPASLLPATSSHPRRSRNDGSCIRRSIRRSSSRVPNRSCSRLRA